MQSPNIKQNPSSFKRDSQTPTEASFGVQEKRRREVWSLYLVIFGVLGLLAGLGVAGIYYSQCQTVYLSKATVVIKSPLKIKILGFPAKGYTSDDLVIRHDLLIAKKNILSKCLVKCNLKDLSSLRGLSKTEQLQEIQNNLTVTAYGDEPMICELQYVAPNPNDAQAVLASIVSTYEQYLAEKYPDTSAETLELLIKMSDKFHKELKAVDERLKAARERVETLRDAGFLEGGEGVLAQVTKELDAEDMDRKKSLLFELEADLRRSEEALEEGRDACMEFIWNREDDTRISPFEYGDKEPSSEEAKVSEDSPEEVMRRFIVSTKQQIRGVRSSLKTDLAAYNENYEMMVEVEKAGKEVRDLLLLKEKFLEQAGIADQQIIEEQNTISTRLRHGFIFETTQPACPGVEVRPMLSVILPVAGLVGASLGLVMGCLVVLVFRGS